MAADTLATRLRAITHDLATAAQAAGRDPHTAQLVAVSKTMPAELIAQAYEAGQRVFGENRVQELIAKKPLLPPDTAWHLIGHLQRNKVKQVVGQVALIHSLDSLRLLEEIEKQAAALGVSQPCLVQVNISGEASKEGAPPDELPALIQAAAQCPHVPIRGLMGIAGLGLTPQETQAQFRALAQLRQDLRVYEDGTHITLQELSMGMSGDYALAIAEGATLVRIGSAIFGARG